MLIQFNKKFLFSSTVMAGLTAVMVAGAPAYAQSTAQPSGGNPQSPASNAPPQTAPDPAMVAPNSDDENQVDSAQEEAAEDDEGEVEAVVVTGSRIRRSPANAPTALIQVGREEVLQSGQVNVVDFLADIPALQGSQVPEDTTQFLNIGGLSLLNLRELGAARTLVLVDGRRHVGSNPGGLSVDVDTIPSLLIENVEVVTGGQSALYGADAVAGVVNFILRRNFEGIEVDGALAQINQDGQLNRRLSGLIGKNLFNDRLNVYAFGEYQKGDEVTDFDIDYRREARGFIGRDVDPTTANNDGILDVELTRGLRDANFTRGGRLVLANQPVPSPATNPLTPLQNCGAVPANPGRTFLNGTNCAPVRPDNPGSIFVFNPDGSFRPFNFGTDQQNTGFTRRINVGGDGLNTGTEFGNLSRLPEQENFRYQTGFNFDLTDELQIFGEAKYVKEETVFKTQATFFTIGLSDINPGQSGLVSGIANFNLGLDNAFLAPGLATIIRNNRRNVINAQGVVTGTVLDPRAELQVFGPSRGQDNTRDLTRYVLGVRGDRDKLFFLDNFSYEVGYTYGEVNNKNVESAVDAERFFFAADAVRDVNNVLGRGAGTIVCRAQLLTANGATIPDQFRGGTLNAQSAQIAGCTPISVFGTDFRADANNPDATGGGGRPGLTQAQGEYILAAVTVQDRNEQQNLLAFASGEILGDFLPAGPIGIAVGYETREETTSGIGRSATTGDRFLFLNTGPDFPEVSYDATEFFTEIRVPLLKNLPFVDTLEVSGAYRTSDYSTVGKVDTRSFQGLYRPNKTFLFRATYGEATRIPNLGENFSPAGQTFLNNFTDPCDANAIRAIDNAQDRANRRANCTAVLGAGYDPGTDTPNTGTRIIYTSGIPGRSGGNPFLVPEDSRSYTIGVAFTPRFARGLSLTADYYDIKVSNVISTVSAGAAATNCVSGTTPNPNACATIFRAGPTPVGSAPAFGIIDFIQGSLNFAALEAKGVDFTGRYGADLADLGVPMIFGRDPGRLDYSIRGSYLIRRENFLNFADPGDATEFDGGVGLPRVRLLSTLTYSPTDRLSLSWNYDFQTSQEILDSDVFLTNGDTRDAKLRETGAFHQHDFSARYEITDNFLIRAGVVNAFDAEPAAQLSSTTSEDIFDLFGRRFFIGGNVKFGAAADRR